MPINNLEDQLRRDEGESLKVYRDTKGILTAGVGHNCEAHHENLSEGDVITQAQSDLWLQGDLTGALGSLRCFIPWSTKLDEVRFAVLGNMSFNMGGIKLLRFHHMLGYAQSGNYTLAAKEMLNSEWAAEVKDRAKRLSIQMRDGIWQ